MVVGAVIIFIKKAPFHQLSPWYHHHQQQNSPLDRIYLNTLQATDISPLRVAVGRWFSTSIGGDLLVPIGGAIMVAWDFHIFSLLNEESLKSPKSKGWNLCDFTVENRDFTTLFEASEEASKAVREELMAEVSWVSLTGENGIELYTCCVGKCGALSEINSSQLKIGGRNPKRKDCLPTIHFQVLYHVSFGESRLAIYIVNTRVRGIQLQTQLG